MPTLGEWVTVNLPFSESWKEPVYPEGPDLTDEFRKKFGMIPEEVLTKLTEDLAHVRADFGVALEEVQYRNSEKIAKKMAKRGGDYAEYFRLRNLYGRMLRWEGKKLEAYQEVCRGLRLEGTFEGLGLRRPGVQVEMADGKRYLIGDINENRGVCNDCTAFESTDIVARYRILIDIDVLEGE